MAAHRLIWLIWPVIVGAILYFVFTAPHPIALEDTFPGIREEERF
ncbi:MAG: hypothetical protein AAGF15_04155 [Pseudomonadota bacterium]